MIKEITQEITIEHFFTSFIFGMCICYLLYKVRYIDTKCEDSFSLVRRRLETIEDEQIKPPTRTPALPNSHEVTDTVDHPAHYNSGAIEVIDALEDWELNFHRANVVKYVARAGKKNPLKEVEDLEKAEWYLNREIERLRVHADEDVK